MKLFAANSVTIAKCVRVNQQGWFFVQNGEPRQIFCHVNQGGVLTVTPAGYLGIEHEGSLPIADINQEIVLARLDENPDGKDYTKARFWTTKLEWDAHKWAFRGGARVTYRAIAHNHRNNGKFQSNTAREDVLATGMLLELVKSYRRTGDKTEDKLQSGYTSALGKLTLSYQVRWERLEANGTWTECGDPRPLANTITQIGCRN